MALCNRERVSARVQCAVGKRKRKALLRELLARSLWSSTINRAFLCVAQGVELHVAGVLSESNRRAAK